MTPHCLSRDVLKALLEDRLAEPALTVAATHFRTCEICQHATEAIFAAFKVDSIPTSAQLAFATDDDPADLHSFLQDLKRLSPGEIESLPDGSAIGDEPRLSPELETVAPGASSTEADRNNPDSAIGDSDAILGTRIGPYRLIERLGHGGFGIVYRAQQDQPIRLTVALKVIKPGMDSHEVIARFQTERQALALMDHPHIARVLNAGTTRDGRPYFVMELVNGLPLTEYCDHYRLTISQRLQLFVTVCDAVQHAHQKGIIHRDLKPSNILVAQRNGAADVKVIDFGIAKALTPLHSDGTAMTSDGQMIGTLLYMAPEQIGTAGIDVDTRCDVYSLGGLLFELLTGSTPFERERMKKLDQWETLRIVREEEPPRPSARLTARADMVQSIAAQRGSSPRDLIRQVRSDLDWIAMKALEKDRNRRYPTTSALAADIIRVLNHETVEACPPTTAYRLRKFVRRNALFLGMTTIVCVALMAGTVVATWQAIRANSATVRAEEAEQVALQAADRSGSGLYAEQIDRAYDRLRTGDHGQASVLLEGWIPKSCEADRRGVEWGLLAQQLRVPGEELMRLTSP